MQGKESGSAKSQNLPSDYLWIGRLPLCIIYMSRHVRPILVRTTASQFFPTPWHVLPSYTISQANSATYCVTFLFILLFSFFSHNQWLLITHVHFTITPSLSCYFTVIEYKLTLIFIQHLNYLISTAQDASRETLSHYPCPYNEDKMWVCLHLIRLQGLPRVHAF